MPILCNWNVKNPDLACGITISEEVKIDVHMLGSLMVYWILTHINWPHIVTEHNNGAAQCSMKLSD